MDACTCSLLDYAATVFAMAMAVFLLVISAWIIITTSTRYKRIE